MKFEDLHLGQEWVSAPHTVSRDEMLSFSQRWDPQRIHIDDEWAAGGPFGGVIGSGFMTAALAWRLWLDTGVQGDDGVAGIGIDGLRWPRPLQAGMNVRAVVRIVEHRVTSGGHGLITFAIQLLNEQDEELVSFRTTGLHARRPAPVAPPGLDLVP
ncbi:MAG: MaoC/PaaZ C-terminal domain-containing protein [Actinomycetota bacterium]